jgi:hypothetical protein
MNRRLLPLVLALATSAVAVACDNAGADRSIGLDATGTISGTVHFDANGSGTVDALDVPFANARVRLLRPTSRDTVLRANTDVDGTFSFLNVPVGTYDVILDSASAGDSAQVIGVDEGRVTVTPGNTVTVVGTISFPQRAAIEVRTLPLGERAFVTGVALHARETFSDTLLHVVDTSGAIRAVRLRPGTAGAVAGDSVRLRGRVALRLGQRVLDDVTVFIIGPTLIPTINTITTGVAATASAGALDASLVRILDADITDSVTVGGNLTLTVNDGSGALTVLLDRAADIAFRAPLPANLYDVGNTFDLVGVLVPAGNGSFVLRPRSSLDLTLR